MLPFSRFIKFSFVICSVMIISSCDLAANYTKTDRAANMEFQDFRDGMSERAPTIENKGESKASLSSIPDLQPYVALSAKNIKSVPLVSLSINQTVPLRDVLYELAEQVGYDLELDPSIRGSIIFTARNKPFDVVIERISKMAGLRYKFEDGFLRVEVDTPYNKTYKISYLSFIRSNDSSVNTSVSVVSGDGADTGSSFSSASESTSDFWGELELNLEQILTGTTTGGLKTQRDPKITATAQNPDIVAISPQNNGDGGVQVKPPEVVLNVESLPVDTDINIEDESNASSSSYTINKQAGLINVYASEQGHKAVEAYLHILRRSVTSQVLVEAKIFEVSLFDEYVNGIEWQALTTEGVARFVEGTDAVIGAITTPGGSIATVSNLGLGYLGSDVAVFIEAIAGFGTVRALASPRLTVLNNQSAVLNVATNKVWFEIDLNRQVDDDTGDVTVEIETNINTVPEGVLINVQPSINLDDRTISMFLRPTITRITGTKPDPGIAFVAGDTGIFSDIPEVNVQEIDTVVKVNSGQAIVMGGLLQDRVINTQEGVPILSEIPLLGAAFRSQDDLISKTELVIFLKATIIESPDETIHDTDRDLYKMFSGDRRPLDL